MLIGSRLTKNVLRGYVTYLQLIVSFFLVPFVVKALGDERYGLWVLTWATTGYFDLFDLGLSMAVAHFVAEHLGREEHDEIAMVLSNCFAVYAAAGLAVLGILAVLAPRFPIWFHISSTYAATASTLILLAGVNAAIGLPMRLFAGLLSGVQRLDVTTYIGVGVSLASAALTVVVLLAGHGLVFLAASVLIANVAGHVVTFIASRKYYGPARLRLRYLNRATLRRVFSFSGHIFVTQVSLHLSYRTDLLVIGWFLPTWQLTHYQIGQRLNEIIRGIPHTIASPSMSAASYLHAVGDRRRLRDLLLLGSRISVEVFTLFLVGGIVLGESFITLWIGHGYYRSFVVFLILASASYAAVIQGVVAAILQGMGLPALLAAAAVGAAIVNFVLSIVLVRWIGLYGVAIGTLVPSLIANFLVVIPYGCRKLEISIGRFLRETASTATFSAMGSAAVAIALRHSWPPDHWLPWCGQAFIFAVTYVALLWVFAPQRYRAEYRRVLARARGPE